MWNKSDEDLVEQAKRELQQLGLADASKVEAGYVVRMPKAYPVYDESTRRNVADPARLDRRARPERASDRSQRHAPVQQPGPLDVHGDARRSRTSSARTTTSGPVNVEEEYHEESSASRHRAARGTGRDAPVLAAGVDRRRRRTSTGRAVSMRVQICTPTYIEADEHRRSSCTGPVPRRPTPTSSCSTTTAPTAPPTSPSASARSSGRSRCCGGRRSAGSATPTAPGSRSGSPVGYDVIMQIDADLSHDPQVIPELLARARRRRGSRDRLAVRARRRDPALAVAPARAVEVRQPLHGVHAAHGRARRDRRVPRVQGRHAAAPSTTRRRARRATASRSSSRTASRVPGGRIDEIPITFTDRVRGQSKMSIAVMVEEMGLVSLVGHPGPPARSPHVGASRYLVHRW